LAVILACNRSEVYFYVYYVAKIIAGIFCEGTMHCLCLAYVVNTTDCNNRSQYSANKRKNNTVKKVGHRIIIIISYSRKKKNKKLYL